jgi:hypothetical protein
VIIFIIGLSFSSGGMGLSKGDRATDYDGAEDEVLKLIAHESDKRIAAQVQIMLASDTRSNALLAAAATMAAAGYAFAGSQSLSNGNYALSIGASVFGVISTMAAIAAIWSLWPADLEAQGWSPKLFVEDIKNSKSLQIILQEIVALNERKIIENEKVNLKISGRVKLTTILLGLAPVIGALTVLLFILIANAPARVAQPAAHVSAVITTNLTSAPTLNSVAPAQK